MPAIKKRKIEGKRGQLWSYLWDNGMITLRGMIYSNMILQTGASWEYSIVKGLGRDPRNENGPVHRELDKMEKDGLLESRKEGRKILYNITKKHRERAEDLLRLLNPLVMEKKPGSSSRVGLLV